MSIKQVWHNYNEWECYKAGMWRKENSNYEAVNLPDIVSFTGDHIKYGEAMMDVVRSWYTTCSHHLTNPVINKKAFIGHAACCFKFGWPEYLVRSAWNQLSKDQQKLANEKAQTAIDYFLNNVFNG